MNKGIYRQINALENPRSKLLFLGYGEGQTRLIKTLADAGCEIWHSEDKIKFVTDFDLVISYGYRHIIKKQTLENSTAPFINLHISFLPWNRGAHPNFWALYDSTPSGVSIHLIDEGIDTGPILFQKRVEFNSEEKTFEQTYARLNQEIEELFVDNLEAIIKKNFNPVVQTSEGTHHKIADLPQDFKGWDSDIKSEIERLKKKYQ